jgi:hypothetical protein
MTSYTPGSAIAAVTDSRVVVLAAEHADVDLLMGAETTALLEELARHGFSAMPAFALVERLEERVRVVVRGSWEVVVDGQVVSGESAATWIEQILPAADVALVRAAKAGGPVAPRWPLTGGVVLASSLEFDLTGVQGPRPAPAVPVSRPPAPIPVEQLTLLEPEAPASEPVDAAATATVPEAEAETLVDQVPDVVERPVAQPVEQPVEQPVDEDGFDSLFGETIGRSAEDAAIREPEPAAPSLIEVPAFDSAPAGSPAGRALPDLRLGDHDDHTVAGRGIAAHLRDPGAKPVTAPDPVRTPVLVISNGERIGVVGAVAVGRRPSARNAVGAPPRLVTVPSPEGVVSGTHLEFVVEDGHLLVRDVSTNGTLVHRPGVDPQRLPAKQLVVLTGGSRLELGDGVSIEVERGGPS